MEWEQGGLSKSWYFCVITLNLKWWFLCVWCDFCVLDNQTLMSWFLRVITSNLLWFLCVNKSNFKMVNFVSYQVKRRSHDFYVPSHHTSKTWFLCVITSNFEVTILACYHVNLVMILVCYHIKLVIILVFYQFKLEND